MERPRRTVLRVIAASLLGLALLTGVGVVAVYNSWNGNLEHPDVVGKNRPTKKTKALNILVMGTDTRDCAGCGIDSEAGGGLSDTTILFHLSADRTFAYGISIPRDTAVLRPACYRADGSEIPAGTTYEKWNEAYKVGGPGCTRQQLEQLTGIPVDRFVVVDFSQFKDMVDALDGVEICVPQEIDDTTGNIHLDAGTREVDGDEALDYARVRYGVSGGIDPYRTRRQQALMGAMIDKALTGGMLARPDRIVSFVDAATTELQTDFKSVAQMAKVATSAKGIDADDIKFITTPWTLDTDKVSGGVEWLPSVERLWPLVIDDRPLTREFLAGSISAGRPPSDQPSDQPSGTPSVAPTAQPGGQPSGGGLSPEERDKAGLCS
ncbi:LytR family transcriptional regulator [Pimelobacter simplex]|uniref:LCP family protein n=1 Tax=Nocardioides simplex TaxID=2045 RepID=UPI0008E6B720|nr:LCP family protein [Pimelobacter simplex]MCG8150559.1 LytR family transcriptional regulator [Pimelobacter simplex]SFM86697.1 transcriptional attenuator, LytR family [Pimelobacter simplex]